MKPRLRPIIRVFVSSTFGDMKHERNALQELVFPRLEMLCEQNGFQFQAIDLRWGVPTEAGLDHRTMRICFEELERAQEISPQPNFLILLGDRYGWRPLPEEISVEEFQALEAEAAQVGSEAAKHLRDWYCKDTNAILPVFVLQSRRQRLADDLDYTRDEIWTVVQDTLWRMINRYMPVEQLSRRFDSTDQPAIVRFQGSATEQEIWCGVLGVPDANEHVLAFFRHIENLDEFPDSAQLLEFADVDRSLGTEQERLKQELRRRLGEANVMEYGPSRLTERIGDHKLDVTTGHLKQLCIDLESRLTQFIQKQIDEYWSQPGEGKQSRTQRELQIEQGEHARFGMERGGAATFVGRDAELKTIADYLNGESRWPLIVQGSSGSGKTALLARAAQDIVDPIVRYIGVTPNSSDVRLLLVSICEELRLRHLRYDPLPIDVINLAKEFREQLGKATDEKPLVLFLDALDQLSDTDNGRALNWLPRGKLPEHVKLVVSCLSDREADDPAGQPKIELERRGIPTDQFLNLPTLTKDEARDLLFERWLNAEASRTVSQAQRQKIEMRLSEPSCRQPIYLKLLFEEVKRWRSYEPPSELGQNVDDLLSILFERLSLSANHGPLLVERTLAYFAASRWGLAETEILELLFADPEYLATLDEANQSFGHEIPDTAKRIPIAIWSRLRFDLSPYLTERAAPGANVLAFYHRQVSEWVEQHFAHRPKMGWSPHERLAEYFQKQADPVADKSWQGNRPRPLFELVFHRYSAEQIDKVCEPLCDLMFVEARCRFGQVFPLIADYGLARELLPSAQAEVQEERVSRERLAQYAREMFAYSEAWSERRDRVARGEDVSDPEPILPQPPPTCPIWTNEEYEADCHRIATDPTQLDKLDAFAGFVIGQTYPLLEFGRQTGFVRQHAFDIEPSGPLHDASVRLLSDLNSLHLLRRWSPEARFNPKPALLRTLEGHGDSVETVGITSDGSWAVSGSKDQDLRVWDMETGQCLHVLKGHGSAVTSVSLTADGQWAVSGSSDKMVRVWNLDRGVCHAKLKGFDSRIGDIFVGVTPSGSSAVTGNNEEIFLWDLQRWKCLRKIEEQSGSVKCLSVTPDGRRAVSGNSKGSIKVWDLKSGNCLQTIEGHKYSVDCLSIAPDGRRTVSAGSDSMVLWDLESGQSLRTFDRHDGWVKSVCVSADGRRVVTASWDHAVRIWDLETGECLRTLAGHADSVKCVSMTPDGRRAISGGFDNTLRVWDLKYGQSTATIDEHTDVVRIVCLTPDGERAISASDDSTLRLWDVITGQCTRIFEGHTSCAIEVCVTPDGLQAVSGSMDRSLRVWNLETGECEQTLLGHSGAVFCLTLTPDGRRVISGSYDHTLRLWDLDSGECLHTLEGHEDTVRCVRLTSDGSRAVSGSDDTSLRIWDLESGKCLFTLDGHREYIRDVSITLDGSRAVSASGDHDLRIWDLESGECLDMLFGHLDYVYSLCLTPNGRQAISGSGDSTLKIWDLETGRCVRTLRGHSSSIDSIGITPDGQYVYSGSNDKTMRIWELETGQCLAVCACQAPITSLTLFNGGKAVGLGMLNGNVQFLDVRSL